MKFEHTRLLWLLLVLPPALLAFFWWAWRERQRLVRLFIDVRLLPGLAVGVSRARWKVRVALLAAAVACLLVAVARPQWGFTLEEARQRGLDIVVAMDTSKSMLAEDVSPNRLARAKLAAMDLMQLARSDRLGLVAFAGSAFLQCPLTLDDSAFRQSLDSLNVQIISQGGTALAEAITTALAAFGKSEGDNYKVLVIFSDGEDHDAGAVEAAQRAAREGMIIFTIGLGTPEGELLRIKDAKGRSDFIRDDQGAMVKSRLNEPLLQQIAGAANGFYLRLSGAKTMEVLYDRGLAPLPKAERTTKQIRRYHEQYHWPLAAAVLLLVVETLLPERRREPTTARKTSSRRAATGVAAGLALIAASAALGSPSAALREYKAGRFEEAMREYRALAAADTNDLRLRFNTGASAYQAKKYDEAVRALTNVLAAPDLALQQQAYYNLGNSFYKLGEQIPVPEIPEVYTSQGTVSATNLPPGTLEAIQQKIALWENSLTNFAGAKKLNELDADAKNNHDLVKRQLVELKKKLPPPPPQQQQSKDDKQDKKEDQDQQDQQQQAKNDPQQQPESKPDPQKDSQQQPQQAQQDQKPQEKKDQPQQSHSQTSQPEKKDQPPQQAQSGQPPKDDGKKDPQEAVAAKPGEMTAKQAQQLLESLKQDEQMLWFKPTNEKPPPPGRPVKDW